MRLINDDRRRRISFLAKRLEDFASARTALLLQLEALDAQASAAQVEHNSLRNLDAPISSLPDEVLAMIFEEGMHPRDLPYHFGVLVSHVTQHWRNVSIATPKFWTSIRCIIEEDDPHFPDILTQRVPTVLSRARSSPLDFHIVDFREWSSDFLQSISDHIGHCRQLRLLYCDHDGLTALLDCTSSQPMPFLSSLELGCPGRYLVFHEQLFSSGAPRLTTACVHSIDITTIHHCLSAFESLTSLQLKYLKIINRGNDVQYSSFRDALMAMPSLHHLDLSIANFEASPGRLPILLPRIQHMHVRRFVHTTNNMPLDSLLHCITAASLVSLSLMNWGEELLELITHASKPHFPSLQHLILGNVSNEVRHLTVLARAFPDIERLTFRPDYSASPADINHIFDTFLCGAGHGDIVENGAPLWPKVQSIALSTSREHLAVPQLKSKILRLQAVGHPIRKLLLPQELHLAMVDVGEIIALEEFYVDWPTPFEWGGREYS